MLEFYLRAKVSNFIIYVFDFYILLYRLLFSMFRKIVCLINWYFFGIIFDWFLYYKIYDNKVLGKLIFIFIFCRCNLKSLIIK